LGDVPLSNHALAGGDLIAGIDPNLEGASLNEPMEDEGRNSSAVDEDKFNQDK